MASSRCSCFRASCYNIQNDVQEKLAKQWGFYVFLVYVLAALIFEDVYRKRGCPPLHFISLYLKIGVWKDELQRQWCKAKGNMPEFKFQSPDGPELIASLKLQVSAAKPLAVFICNLLKETVKAMSEQKMEVEWHQNCNRGGRRRDMGPESLCALSCLFQVVHCQFF